MKEEIVLKIFDAQNLQRESQKEAFIRELRKRGYSRRRAEHLAKRLSESKNKSAFLIEKPADSATKNPGKNSINKC